MKNGIDLSKYQWYTWFRKTEKKEVRIWDIIIIN
nr:MAG TPA: hypothetical protein [Caudoviricetes sp.]